MFPCLFAAFYPVYVLFSLQVTKIATAIFLCLSISPPVYKPTPCISPPNHRSEHVQAQGLLTEFYGSSACLSLSFNPFIHCSCSRFRCSYSCCSTTNSSNSLPDNSICLPNSNNFSLLVILKSPDSSIALQFLLCNSFPSLSLNNWTVTK